MTSKTRELGRQSKYIRRRNQKLAIRIAHYEGAVKRDKANGKGLCRPGSQNVRKGG